MISTALSYIRRAPQIYSYVRADPVEAWLRLQAKAVKRWERRRPPCLYVPDAGWERRLHEILGVQWPCEAAAEFWELWPRVIGSLEAKGLRVGVGHFNGWNDGDPALVRAIWCLTRHLRPRNVVETGVARGVTSRFVLEALERNGAGHLWSIDLPPSLATELHEQIGAAVATHCRHRWSYIRGSSRRRLPGLLASLAQIDLFVHDSLHTESNVRFELERAWAALRPGGAVVADDIDLNWGFRSFTQAGSDHKSLVCGAEPLEPEPFRPFNGRGLFGIAQKIGDRRT
jgi:hypothetical protein